MIVLRELVQLFIKNSRDVDKFLSSSYGLGGGGDRIPIGRHLGASNCFTNNRYLRVHGTLTTAMASYYYYSFIL